MLLSQALVAQKESFSILTELPGTALHCSTLYLTELICNLLHCTALQSTALHCTTLHCTALHCTALFGIERHIILCFTLVQCGVLCCTVLYLNRTAVYYNHWYGQIKKRFLSPNRAIWSHAICGGMTLINCFFSNSGSIFILTSHNAIFLLNERLKNIRENI